MCLWVAVWIVCGRRFSEFQKADAQISGLDGGSRPDRTPVIRATLNVGFPYNGPTPKTRPRQARKSDLNLVRHLVSNSGFQHIRMASCIQAYYEADLHCIPYAID